MSVVLDTSAIVAAYDRADPGHEAVAELLRALDDELVTTPLVAAQMDRALTGTKGRDALWRDLDCGACASYGRPHRSGQGWPARRSHRRRR